MIWLSFFSYSYMSLIPFSLSQPIRTKYIWLVFQITSFCIHLYFYCLSLFLILLIFIFTCINNTGINSNLIGFCFFLYGYHPPPWVACLVPFCLSALIMKFKPYIYFWMQLHWVFFKYSFLLHISRETIFELIQWKEASVLTYLYFHRLKRSPPEWTFLPTCFTASWLFRSHRNREYLTLAFIDLH